MIQHCRCPGEPRNELKPQSRIGRNARVIESEHESSDSTTIHLLVRSVATVSANDFGIRANRFRVGRWPAELLCPVRSESLGVSRVDALFERVSEDRVGQTPRMPRSRHRQERVGTADLFEDRWLHPPIVTSGSRRRLAIASRVASSASNTEHPIPLGSAGYRSGPGDSAEFNIGRLDETVPDTLYAALSCSADCVGHVERSDDPSKFV